MDEIKELYFKYKFIIWPLLSGIVSLVVLIFIIIPQFLMYFDTNKKIEELRTQSMDLDTRAAEADLVDSAVIRQDLKLTYGILPADKTVPESAIVLQNLVNKSGLGLKSMVYNPAVISDQGKTSYGFDVTVVGTVESIRNFLVNIKLSPRIFEIESLSAKFQNSGSSVEASIPLIVFYDSTASSSAKSSSKTSFALSAQDDLVLADVAKITKNGDALKLILSQQSSGSANPALGKKDPFN